MGITAVKSEKTRTEPMLSVLLQMCKNRDIMLLFFAYWVNMIGSTNTRTGATVLVSKVYGFTDSNYAKAYSETTQLVTIGLASAFSLVFTKPFIKLAGEVRVIIFSQYCSILESMITFGVNMPQPKPMMYVTLTLCSITLIFCDAIFLQLVSMYTVPQNRGQTLGIF